MFDRAAKMKECRNRYYVRRKFLLVSLILLLCGISYAPIVAADAPPLEAAMISLDHQLFPFIYLSVAVNRYGEGISTLTKSNFQVTENGVLQTDYFDVIPPQAGGGVRLVDIVFLMDNSGSMIQEQNAVRDNVIKFVNDLAASDVDYALGLCRFGATQNGGNPIIEDNGTLTTDPEYFKNTLWNRNVVNGGHEPGWDALYEAANGFAFRPGSQKVFILITDECVTHPGDTNYGDYSYNDALNALEDRSVTAFALIDLDYTNSIEDYGTIAEATNGQYFDIYSQFDDILGYISSQVANTYRITYKSSNPAFDGIERHVVVTVSYQGDQATCDGTYTPGSAPRIRRTQDTLALHDQSWAAGTEFTIEAEITDDVVPYVQSATLYYRTTGDATYASTSMTHSSDIWSGTIPGSAVETPGVDYYISATDGESTATSPPVDPRTRPHQLAILPNHAPQITHTPVTTAMANTPVTITAEVVDTTNALDSIELWYRKVGQLIFKTNGQMANIGGDTYQDTIPSSYVTEAGVEYCILAYDDLGVGNWHGSFFDPHVITVSGNQAPETTIKTANIDPANGTAKFTWSGSDDKTPPAQLVYKHRLLNPDSPIYDWWPKDEEWSSNTTATYPRSPDSCLPDGTYRFQVKAKDADGAIQPSPTTYEFTIGEEGPLNCIVHLRPHGIEASIGVIGDFETFDIYVGASTGDIKQVRFSSDESLDETPTGEWTEWYDWDTPLLFSPWDAAAKTMEWSFATGGNKEVWAEVRDGAGNNDKAYAYILVQVPEWRKDLRVGDILYDPCGAVLNIGHVGIYIGYGWTADPQMHEWRHKITTWDADRRPNNVQILRVIDPSSSAWEEEKARPAAKWAEDTLSPLGSSYRYQMPAPLPDKLCHLKWPDCGTCTFTKNANKNEADWYCSELVWAAYFNQEVNIENDRDVDYSDKVSGNVIRPHEICDDNLDIKPVGGHDGSGAPVSFKRSQCGCYSHGTHGAIKATCPVNLIITDPDGLIISKDLNEVPDAFYWIDDLDGDDSPDVVIELFFKEGVYRIQVEPRPEAKSTDTYTLVFEDYGTGQEITLADGILIENIPDEPYKIEIAGTGESPVVNQPPEISISSPGKGEVISSSSFQVQWQATDSDNPASSLSIDLFYSTNGGTTWTSIAINETNDGAYDWDISALQGGEYWLRAVATDPEGEISEATVGPFTIVALEGSVILGPNPVTGMGTTFYYALPDGISTAKLMILNVTGRLVFETPIEIGESRFPNAGTWNPVDNDGIPLGNGPYIYVLIADGKVIGQGKMVIQR